MSRRKTNRDHAKKQHQPAVEDEIVAAQLEQLLTPAIFAQSNYYRQLGLRNRILNLPLMLAAVLTLLWRNVPGVRELTRILDRQGFLWCQPTRVSNQAMSERFLTFPAELFERVFKEILVEFRAKWHSRKQRSLPPSIEFTRAKFERIWACDGSTMEAIFRKLDSLADVPIGQLAGKMGVVIDLITRLPVEIWFLENAKASDTKLEVDILNLATAGTLLLLDRGFYHFKFWYQLIEQKVQFITRLKKGAALQVQQVFTNSYSIRDRVVRMGTGTDKMPYVTLRLVEIKSGKIWHSYLTSVLDPLILPPYVVADLYGRRWRIEEAFNTVKRLLGLSYLWTGSINGIKLQLWGTWLFYAVLVDLGDAVAAESFRAGSPLMEKTQADEMTLPFDRISLEMVYRGLDHFYVAHHSGARSGGFLQV